MTERDQRTPLGGDAGRQVEALHLELTRLHTHAGAPSTRQLAAASGGVVSHSTVQTVLRGRRLPSWRTLAAVVAACEGDREYFHRLWVRAWSASVDRAPSPDLPPADLPAGGEEPSAESPAPTVIEATLGHLGRADGMVSSWWVDTIATLSVAAAGETLLVVARRSAVSAGQLLRGLLDRTAAAGPVGWMCDHDPVRAAQILDTVAGEDIAAAAVLLAGISDATMVTLAGAIRQCQPGLLPILRSVLGEGAAPGLLTTRHRRAGWLGAHRRWQEAGDEYRAVLQIRGRVLGEEHRDTVATRYLLADALQHQGRPESARREFRHVWRACTDLLGPDHPDTLRAQYRLATVTPHERTGGDLEQIALASHRALGAGHPHTWTVRHDLAARHDRLGELGAAETGYRAVLAARHHLLGRQHADTAETTACLALLLCRADPDNAEPWLQEALATLPSEAVIRRREVRTALAGLLHQQQRLSEEVGQYDAILHSLRAAALHTNPDALSLRCRRATALRLLGRTGEAEIEYRQVGDAQRRVLGGDDPRTLATRHQLANLLRHQDRLSEAALEYQAVLVHRQQTLAADHPDVLATRHHLATVQTYQGHLSEAIDTYRDVLQARRRVLGADHPATAATWTRLAAALALANNWDEAASQYRAVLAHQCRVLGDQHHDTIRIRQQLSALLLVAEQHDPTVSCTSSRPQLQHSSAPPVSPGAILQIAQSNSRTLLKKGDSNTQR